MGSMTSCELFYPTTVKVVDLTVMALKSLKEILIMNPTGFSNPRCRDTKPLGMNLYKIEDFNHPCSNPCTTTLCIGLTPPLWE